MHRFKEGAPIHYSLTALLNELTHSRLYIEFVLEELLLSLKQLLTQSH